MNFDKTKSVEVTELSTLQAQARVAENRVKSLERELATVRISHRIAMARLERHRLWLRAAELRRELAMVENQAASISLDGGETAR